MRSHSYSSPGFRRSGGAALIIVLAFIILLTTLVMAFFSRALNERQVAYSSANQTKVASLAFGALDSIISDFQQEIAAGSITTTVSLTTGTRVATITIPTSPITVVPCLALSGTSAVTGNSFAPNLVKRSAYAQSFFSGSNYNLSSNTLAVSTTGTPTSTVAYTAANRAAGSSTTGTSQNGRSISLARWNKALLLPKKDPNSSTDFTPVTTGGSNVFLPPDWILIARDGSNPKTWSTNMVYSSTNSASVVGRYAYAIYDEGGLLDANVAGYPSITGTDIYANKGSLALADLTVTGLGAAQIDALVGWRNYASATPSGSLHGSFSFDATSGSNYYNYLLSNTTGFMTTGNRTLNSGQSDRIFPSRQTLIKFFSDSSVSSSNALASVQNSLQYLGTFSRDLEQPSFVPDPNRPKNTRHVRDNVPATNDGNGNDTYDPTGAKQDAINPVLLKVRDANGDPVLKRRFPLNRLAWLTYKGPSADNLSDSIVQQMIAKLGGTPGDSTDPVYQFLAKGTADNINKYFGLTWTSGQWTYDHGDPARIFQLSEVPSDREPDFFETLKAVIHCDSLGKQNGGLDTQLSPHYLTGALIDGMIHYQIMQIAANLIDQFDLDSYPTHLSFNGWDLYGVENLPYLAGWQQMWYRQRALTKGVDYPDTVTITTTSGTTKTTGTVSSPDNGVYETAAMVQPIIWNPHAPDTSTSPLGAPTQFRVAASGSAGLGAGGIAVFTQVAPAWWSGTTAATGTYPYKDTAPSSWIQVTTSSGDKIMTPGAFVDPDTSILTFTSGTSYREPIRLCLNGSPTDLSPRGYSSDKMAQPMNISFDSTLAAAEGGSQVIGFYCGKAWTGGTGTVNGVAQGCSYLGTIYQNLMLTLQYKDASGNWQTYDEIEQVYNSTSRTSFVDENNPDSTPSSRGFRACFRADPRTSRWGLFGAYVYPTKDLSKLGFKLSSPFAFTVVGKVLPGFYLPQSITLMPNVDSSYRGVSNASGGPAAPGWVISSSYNLGDLMVNLPKRSTANPDPNPNAGPSTATSPGEKFFYTDPDMVFRRASGWNFSGTNGLPLYTANADYSSRPVILNRPFRSVAEMGYAFRGVAWKELDFFSPESGDAALLDAFCVNDLGTAPSSMLVAGRVNLNTRQPKVIQALLQGVSKAEGGILSGTDAGAIANELVKWTGNVTSGTAGVLLKGPLRNRSELVGKYISSVTFGSSLTLSGNAGAIAISGAQSYSGFASVLTGTGSTTFSSVSDKSIKRRAECAMRALADSGNTRTWNLMIDLVAQTGRYLPTAKNATNPLDQFTVEGETRYWVHVAIDRYTGEVLETQVEPVSE